MTVSERANESGHDELATGPPKPLGPTWLEVDLSAIRHNLSTVSERCGPGVRVIAVVKADGYGHGAEKVSRAAVEAGAWGAAVARVEEGVALRESGFERPVLVLGYATEEELRLALEHDLTMGIGGWQSMLMFAALASAAGRRARVHVKVDTGMRRFGVDVSEAAQFVEATLSLESLELEGVFTHFATADEPEGATFKTQLARFRKLVEALEARGQRPPIVHAANSAAAIACPESHFDAVRVGIAMYGARPMEGVELGLEPAMRVLATVGRVLDVRSGEGVSYGHDYIAERDHRAAVVTIGYADGYVRSLGGRGELLLHGRRCRVIGRVCMDSVVVRLPDDLTVAVGDEAVVLGRSGDDEVTADELAQRAGTISYEILCGMGRRSARLYKD